MVVRGQHGKTGVFIQIAAPPSELPKCVRQAFPYSGVDHPSAAESTMPCVAPKDGVFRRGGGVSRRLEVLGRLGQCGPGNTVAPQYHCGGLGLEMKPFAERTDIGLQDSLECIVRSSGDQQVRRLRHQAQYDVGFGWMLDERISARIWIHAQFPFRIGTRFARDGRAMVWRCQTEQSRRVVFLFLWRPYMARDAALVIIVSGPDSFGCPQACSNGIEQ